MFLHFHYLSSSSKHKSLEMNLLLIFPDMVPHMKYARFRDLQQRNENTNKLFFSTCHALKLHLAVMLGLLLTALA